MRKRRRTGGTREAWRRLGGVEEGCLKTGQASRATLERNRSSEVRLRKESEGRSERRRRQLYMRRPKHSGDRTEAQQCHRVQEEALAKRHRGIFLFFLSKLVEKTTTKKEKDKLIQQLQTTPTSPSRAPARPP
jgi:hypothetical protein